MDPTQMEISFLKQLVKHMREFINSSGNKSTFDHYLVQIGEERFIELEHLYNTNMEYTTPKT